MSTNLEKESQVVDISEGEVLLGTKPIPVKEIPEAPPTFRDYLKYIGPGVIFSALGIGGFESMHVPYVVGYLGFFRLLFLFTGFGLLSTVLARELGRYTLATGETILMGMRRLPGGAAITFIFLWALANFSMWFWPGWASSAAVPLSVLLTGTKDYWPMIAVANILLVAVIFALSSVIYKVLRIIMYVTYILTVVLLVIAFIGLAVRAPEIAGKAVVYAAVPTPGIGADLMALLGISIMLFIPILNQPGGGTMNSWSCYWIREARMGMGAHTGRVTGLSAKPEDVLTSAIFDVKDSKQLASFRRWLRHYTIEFLA